MLPRQRGHNLRRQAQLLDIDRPSSLRIDRCAGAEELDLGLRVISDYYAL